MMATLPPFSLIETMLDLGPKGAPGAPAEGDAFAAMLAKISVVPEGGEPLVEAPALARNLGKAAAGPDIGADGSIDGLESEEEEQSSQPNEQDQASPPQQPAVAPAIAPAMSPISFILRSLVDGPVASDPVTPRLAAGALHDVAINPDDAATVARSATAAMPAEIALALGDALKTVGLRPDIVSTRPAGGEAAAPVAPAREPVADVMIDLPPAVFAPTSQTARAPEAMAGFVPQQVPLDAALLAAPVSASAPIEQMVERQLDLVHEGEWLDLLARDIARTAGGEGNLRFRLNPEHLGSLHVELTQGAAGASVRLIADTEAAHAIIVDAQPRLVAEARAQGVRIAETHVDLGGGHASPQHGDHRETRGRPGEAYLTSLKPEASEGAVTPNEVRHASDRYA